MKLGLLLPAVLLPVFTTVAAKSNDDLDISELLQEIPHCGSRCYRSGSGSSTNDSSSAVSDFCLEQGAWGQIQGCVLLQCSTFDRFKYNQIQSQNCAHPVHTREKRFYLLLVAEVPAFVFLGLRIFASWKSTNGLQVDDYILLACWLVYSAYIGDVYYAHHMIFDVNSSTIHSDELSTSLGILLIADKLALVCLALAKAAVLYTYLRAFPGTRFRVMAFATLALIIVSALVLLFVFIFQCSPVSFAWKGWAQDSSIQKCVDPEILAYVKQAFDIGQNIALLVLPVPLLYRVGMSLGAKLKAALFLAFGCLGLAMAGMRLVFFTSQRISSNQPWEYSDQLIWTGVEISALIIFVCLPGIWEIFPTVEQKPTTYARRLQTRSYLKHKPLPPVRTRSNASVLRKKSVKKGQDVSSDTTVTEDLQTPDLHLGDKMRGDVWTQIKGGHRFSSHSMISRMSGILGIQVRTATTTRFNYPDTESGTEGSVIWSN